MKFFFLLRILLFSLRTVTIETKKYEYVKAKFFEPNSAIAKRLRTGGAGAAKSAFATYSQIKQGTTQRGGVFQKIKPKPKSLKLNAFARLVATVNFKPPAATTFATSNWTYIQDMPKNVNEFTTRQPHIDIGYYDPVQYEHRRYMRIMADAFGVYGFCYTHYWSHGDAQGAVHEEALERMLVDGEPNKPFFLSWDNNLSGAGASSHDSHYSDPAYIETHFRYLLRFFQHPKYIRIQNRPVFALHRIPSHDSSAINHMIVVWTDLAVEAGLGGIYFVRCLGDAGGDLSPSGIGGYLDLEPQRSWMELGGGPSIFKGTGGTFDESEFLRSNPDLDSMSTSPKKHNDTQEGPRQKRFIASQYKIYGKELTWQTIEDRINKNTIYGTFFNWNNAPLRNYTNSDYANYPHMLLPDTLDGFEEHLTAMVVKTDRNIATFPDRLLMLYSWNLWAEQSALEPSDVDGYAALMAVKRVVGTSIAFANKIIVHISNSYSHSYHLQTGRVANIYDTVRDRYIADLASMHTDYVHVTHVYFSDNVSDIALLHVHSHHSSSCCSFYNSGCEPGSDMAHWTIIDTVREYKSRANVRVYVTVHDYQYLFPDSPFPDNVYTRRATPVNLRNTRDLFILADRVIFPSQAIRNYYFEQLRRIPTKKQKGRGKEQLLRSSSSSISSRSSNICVVPHMDAVLSHSHRCSGSNSSNSSGFSGSGAVLGDSLKLNIALISEVFESDEVDAFVQLAQSFRHYRNNGSSVSDKSSGSMGTLRYHMFGTYLDIDKDYELSGSNSSGDSPFLLGANNVAIHDKGVEDKILNDITHNKIHVLVYLSSYPVAHSYKLTKVINSGLPIVYLDPGPLAETIGTHKSQPKYFPVTTLTLKDSELLQQVKNAVKFATRPPPHSERGCRFTKLYNSLQTQPSRWYLSNYPFER